MSLDPASIAIGVIAGMLFLGVLAALSTLGLPKGRR